MARPVRLDIVARFVSTMIPGRCHRLHLLSLLGTVCLLTAVPRMCAAQEPENPADLSVTAGNLNLPAAGEAQELPLTTVLFIFDCSGSMSRPVSGGLPGVSRFDFARGEVINTIKTRLPAGQYRVGLILYGHRVGWERENPTTRRLNAKMIAAGIDPASLHPSLDVEIVVPLRMMSDQLQRDLANALQRARPWGQTPLYDSIKRGLEQLADDEAPANRPRRLIVITDGEDDPGTLAQARHFSVNDIVSMSKEHRFRSIELDIVALDFEPGTNLAQIADAFGGSVHKVRGFTPGTVVDPLFPGPP